MFHPAARYHHWLEEARAATSNPALHRLIDDVHADIAHIAAFGPLGAEVASVVRGALASIASAIDVDTPVPATVRS